MSEFPYTVTFDLGTLSEALVERVLSPSPAERAAIADWLEIAELTGLNATVQLSRLDGDLYSYEAKFAADVVQSCVVTLQPVASRVEGEFNRLFRTMPKRKPKHHKEETLPRRVTEAEIMLEDEDGPETLDSPWLNLAEPVLEELSLNLDPYPRAPGVAFAEPPEPDEPVKENPFAVLKALQLGQPKDPKPPGKTGKKG